MLVYEKIQINKNELKNSLKKKKSGEKLCHASLLIGTFANTLVTSCECEPLFYLLINLIHLLVEKLR